jgi:hypothetical protein
VIINLNWRLVAKECIMDELHLSTSAGVHFHDGQSGSLRKLVLDPSTHRVTHLVVRAGLFQKHEWVIPIAVVGHATPEEIRLNVSQDQLTQYPEYREAEFVRPDDDWEMSSGRPNEHVLFGFSSMGLFEYKQAAIPMIRRRITWGVPEGEMVIGRAMVVRNHHGDVGKVDHLWIDRDSWEITHIVVQRGLLPNHTIIPVAWIEGVDESGIFIRGDDTELQKLPHYRSHMDPASMPGEEAAIIEHLDSNLTMAARVTDALAQNPHTAAAVIEVIYERGAITLLGEVESMAGHLAAEEIAAKQPGVLSVCNELVVKPGAPAIEPEADLIAKVSGVASLLTSRRMTDN